MTESSSNLESKMRLSLLTLPIEILFMIFPFLSTGELLNLCSACKTLYPLFTADKLYWKNLTLSTFRLPDRPSDTRGEDFYFKLYHRLLTQTSVQLWGQHSYYRRTVRADPNLAKKIFMLPEVGTPPGIISDHQIGGWSTTFLTSNGILWTVGMIERPNRPNGDDFRGNVQPLTFDGYVPLTDYKLQLQARIKPDRGQDGTDPDPRFTIRSFSAGHESVLGLSDDGTVWFWFNRVEAAIEVRFPSIAHTRKITRVFAGWKALSVYIPDYGIVIFDPPPEQFRLSGKPYVPSFYLVSHSWASSDQFKHRGVLTSYVLLEKAVVFTTDLGKIFVSKYPSQVINNDISDSYQLTLEDVVEVQGSFRSFAAFKHGQVFIGNENDVLGFVDERKRTYKYDNKNPEDLPEDHPMNWRIIPALQNTGVLQIAFADWHFLALHMDGTITSYGHSPNDCGNLGLKTIQGLERFLPHKDWEPRLYPYGYMTGRRVLFHPTQRDYAEAVCKPNVDVPHEQRSEFSEWIEQRLKNWHLWPEVAAINEEGLPAHFVWNVAAGGHSSGALVLTNETVSKKIEEVAQAKDWLNPNFSVELPSGYIWNNGVEPRLDWLESPPKLRFKFTGSPRDSVFGVVGWREEIEAEIEHPEL